MVRNTSYAGWMEKKADVNPFRIEVPESELDDLRGRLIRTRRARPVPGTESDWSHGISPGYLHELADYWADGFDWRVQEADLNEYDQFTTEIDGQTIHFVHVRSAEPDATPLLLSHGYPSSFVEFVDVIGPLVDPRSHRGDPRDAFHVVVASLPGYTFSAPLSARGWGSERTAKAFAELMGRLGYERFGAQGTDLGAGVVEQIAALFPERLIGRLKNAYPNQIGMAGEDFPVPEGLSDEDLEKVKAVQKSWSQQKGYQDLIKTQPNALAAGLTDSPILQLAWIAERYKLWTDEKTPIDRDRLLTVVSLYWFTRAGGSSADFFWESAHSGGWSKTENDVPLGIAAFGSSPLLRKVIDPNEGTFYSEHPVGGHFPGLEVPDLLVDDIRAFFRNIRD